MDSCVLIPPEFGLVMMPHPGKLLEMTATLWTRRVLVPGMEFFPDRGEIRLDRLEVFSRIKESDVRRHYGCTEDIWLVDGSEVRHCNWVRFLRTCNDPAEANIMGSKVDQHTVYRVLKCIPPNRELVAYLEPLDSLEDTEEIEKEIEEIKEKRIKLEPKEPEHSMMRYSPVSPVSPCSPTSREDECLSGQSDDACETTRSSRTLLKSESSEDDCLTAMDLTISRPISLPRSETVSPPIRRNRERTWLPCEVCGKKFDRPSLLKRHMRTHTGEKPHACDVCGKAFSTSSSLNTHRRIHSGEKPHQCNVCGKCFTASSNLYYHRMTHNKEKPHKCNLCAKSFPTPGDLKSHMYVHNGSWPFKCDICNRGFSKQTNLKNHLILHTGEKPYECNLCGKKFALQCNLKAHTKSHEGETQEECAKCGKGFLTSSKQLYNGFCKMCFSGSPPSDKSSEKSSFSSPVSDFSISSLTSNSDIERERTNSAKKSLSSRRISIGSGSPPTPTIAFPVPVRPSHQAMQPNGFFNGGSPVSSYPRTMPTTPPGPADRQFFLQGFYSQMMSDRHVSPPSAMHDGYFSRVNTQIPVMASHY